MLNVDEQTASDWGEHWSKDDQSSVDMSELRGIFEAHFQIFPWRELPAGEVVASAAAPIAAGLAVGLIEGWRGPVLLALQVGADGAIQRCHAHDPSWQNWPALEHAIIGNIVPDFPLINKSFNLAYSGHDL